MSRVKKDRVPISFTPFTDRDWINSNHHVDWMREQLYGQTSYMRDLIAVIQNARPKPSGRSDAYDLGMQKGLDMAVGIMLALAPSKPPEPLAPPDYGAESILSEEFPTQLPTT